MTSLSDDKVFLKLRAFLLECERIDSRFNFFSGKYLVFKADVSTNDSIDRVARISGKEEIAGFTLKADTLLDTEGLGGEK